MNTKIASITGALRGIGQTVAQRKHAVKENGYAE